MEKLLHIVIVVFFLLGGVGVMKKHIMLSLFVFPLLGGAGVGLYPFTLINKKSCP
jgi:hypothetical protein